MRTVSSNDVRRDWQRIAGEAARQPIRVAGDDANSVVVVSEAEFERLKGQAWDRLFSTLDRMSSEAKAADLTDQKLRDLLIDES
jgi:PHD/YefM family antitoxin component YafN of YafNO toxin-antitoxin module